MFVDCGSISEMAVTEVHTLKILLNCRPNITVQTANTYGGHLTLLQAFSNIELISLHNEAFNPTYFTGRSKGLTLLYMH